MLNPDLLLSGLPIGLRAPLLATYRSIARNYLERRWEPSELNGGKFCEVVYTILQGALAGQFDDEPRKPPNLRDACLGFERTAPNSSRVGDRSLRILIPRMLVALYEIRNNRGVGHIGGDVSPNQLDAAAVYGMTSWILADLIRIFHAVPIEEAQAAADALVQRRIPLIWDIGPVRRVLQQGLSAQDQVLLLLYQEASWVSVANLLEWVEYKGKSMFPARVLIPLHNKRLIEFDQIARRAQISPTGIELVEETILRVS